MQDSLLNSVSELRSEQIPVWIVCCGMKRSGSTLQYQLAGSIVEKAGIGRLVGTVLPQEFATLRVSYASANGFLVVKSHSYIGELAPFFESGRCKALYSYRDVRDVVVSMKNMANQSFEQLIEKGFVETILADYEKWTQCSPLLISKYEDMMADIAGEARRIAEFLNVKLDSATVEAIALDHTLEKQREKINRFRQEKEQKGQDDKWDSQSLLHTNHIRSGKAEQWRTELSDAQIATIEGIAGEWLEAHGYTLSQPLLQRKLAGAGRLVTRVQKRLKTKK